MNAETKIIKARVRLLISQPFFGTLAMHLIPIETDFYPTAATDGIYLYYNPQWINKLSLENVEFVFGHEVLHCILEHFKRELSSYDHDKWNIATDYAVNSILYRASVGVMPNGALYDRKFDGMYAEKIYKLLPNNPKGCTLDTHLSQGQGSGMTTPGAAVPVWNDELSRKWKAAAVSAAEVARQMGNLPAEIERIVKDIINPKIKWSEVLRRFIENIAVSDFQWIPPNRRFVHQGLVLPSVRKQGLTVVVAIDTSGSISDKELQEFVSETTEILRVYNTEAYVISCDCAVNSVQYFPMGTQVSFSDIKIKGDGGTSFIPVFEYIENNLIKPNVLIYFTDAYGLFPMSQPEYPVIWVVVGDGKVPFGELIKLEV